VAASGVRNSRRNSRLSQPASVTVLRIPSDLSADTPALLLLRESLLPAGVCCCPVDLQPTMTQQPQMMMAAAPAPMIIAA
jgi:hypothetical protein